MNKIKMFFAAAALTLVTAGVFAGKAKFATPALYAGNASAYYPLVSSPAFVDFNTTGGVGETAATIVSSKAQQDYELYYETSSGTYEPVYTSF